MKKLLLIGSLMLTFLTGFVPTSRAGIFIEIGDRPYYRGSYYWGPRHAYYYWVPGHWGWRYHHRAWIHGHYAVR